MALPISVDFGAMSTGAQQLNTASELVRRARDLAQNHRSTLQGTWRSSASNGFGGAIDRLNHAHTMIQAAIAEMGQHVATTNAGFQTTDHEVAGQWARRY